MDNAIREFSLTILLFLEQTASPWRQISARIHAHVVCSRVDVVILRRNQMTSCAILYWYFHSDGREYEPRCLYVVLCSELMENVTFSGSKTRLQLISRCEWKMSARASCIHNQDLFWIVSYCFCLFGEFAKVFERKVWRVQAAHLHSAARVLPSLSWCFQLSTNLDKDFFRYLLCWDAALIPRQQTICWIFTQTKLSSIYKRNLIVPWWNIKGCLQFRRNSNLFFFSFSVAIDSGGVPANVYPDISNSFFSVS